MSRKIIFSIVSLVTVVCFVFNSGYERRAQAQLPEADIEGTYLFAGGLAYLKIKAGEAGELSITEFSQPLISSYLGGLAEEQTISYDLTLSGNQLRIETEASNPFAFLLEASDPSFAFLLKMMGNTPEPREPHYLLLQISPGGSGDLDLAEKKIDAFGEDHVQRYDPAIPAYLHRFDDPRIATYFDVQRVEKNPAGALAIATGLIEDYPDDLHVRCLYLEASLKARQMEEFGARLDQWEADLEASPDSKQRTAARFARYIIESAAMAESGSSAYEFYHTHMGWNAAMDAPPGETTTVEEWVADFPSITQFDHLRVPFEELNTRHGPQHTFLGAQVLAKVMRVEVNFLLLQGKRDQALDILHASAHHGWLTRTVGMEVSNLIGIALQNIALLGLENYVLNGCETEAEFESVARVLSDIRPQLESMDFRDPFNQEPPDDPTGVESLKERLLDMHIREATHRTRLELLRLAVAARWHLAARGRFPETEAELTEFLNDAMPADPNGDGSIKFKTGADEFVIYGIGPDLIDDGGRDDQVPYYGNLINGDIVVRVPRERKYPFPSSPLVANSKADVLAVFPNGLPADTFAFTRNLPLQITDSVPVYIYSYGPDVDENQTTITPGPLGPGLHPEPQYDPRAGETSDGDLWYRVPTSEEDL